MAILLARKRSGAVVDFDRSRIESAISRAYQASKVLIDIVSLSELVDKVVADLEANYTGEHIPEVEDIQNIVENFIGKNMKFKNSSFTSCFTLIFAIMFVRPSVVL